MPDRGGKLWQGQFLPRVSKSECTIGTFEGIELRLKDWGTPRDGAQKTKEGERLVLPALPNPRTPIPHLSGPPAQVSVGLRTSPLAARWVLSPLEMR